jgi:hypothetical protein
LRILVLKDFFELDENEAYQKVLQAFGIRKELLDILEQASDLRLHIKEIKPLGIYPKFLDMTLADIETSVFCASEDVRKLAMEDAPASLSGITIDVYEYFYKGLEYSKQSEKDMLEVAMKVLGTMSPGYQGVILPRGHLEDPARVEEFIYQQEFKGVQVLYDIQIGNMIAEWRAERKTNKEQEK